MTEEPSTQKNKLFWLPPLLLFIAALSVRLIGIKWGLPNEHHLFSYHPDESLLLAVAQSKIDLLHGRWDPEFYNYGSGYLYLLSIISMFVHGYGGAPASAPVYQQISALLLAGRFVNVLFSAGSAVVSYFIGKRVTGLTFGGLAGGLLIAFSPALVMHSCFQTVDIPAMFFVSQALLYSVKIVQEHQSIKKVLIAAGIFVGLAAGFKYNAGLVIIAPLASCILLEKKKRLISAVTIFAASIVTFLITTPGIIFNFSQFWHDFSFERAHMQNANFDLTFQNTPPGWVYHLLYNLPQCMNFFLILLSIIGLLFSTKSNKYNYPLLIFGLVYFLIIGSFQIKYLRYLFPFMPVMSVGLASFYLRFAKTNQKFIAILISLFFLPTIYQTFLITNAMSETDGRDLAADYLYYNAHGKKIGLVKQPWFYTPPLFNTTNVPGDPSARLEAMKQCKDFQIVSLQNADWNLSLINVERPDFIVISEFEWRDEQRLKMQNYDNFMQQLNTNYNLIKDYNKEFNNTITRLNFGMRRAHDMLYVQPEVQIWQRK